MQKCKHHAGTILAAAVAPTFTADPLRPLVGKSACSMVTLVANPLKAPTPAAPPMLQAERIMGKVTLTDGNDNFVSRHKQGYHRRGQMLWDTQQFNLSAINRHVAAVVH